eukprot:RCo050729
MEGLSGSKKRGGFFGILGLSFWIVFSALIVEPLLEKWTSVCSGEASPALCSFHLICSVECFSPPTHTHTLCLRSPCLFFSSLVVAAVFRDPSVNFMHFVSPLV